MNRDYIVRMIEQFMQALVEIIKLRKAGNHEEAFQHTQNASQRYLQTDITTLLNNNLDQLLEYFKGDTYRC